MARRTSKPRRRQTDIGNRADAAGEQRHFALHWGSGVIEEEVRTRGPYHCPAIQLLRFTAGAAAGAREIRFCYYDHSGRFQRSPLIVGEDDIADLRRALEHAPALRAMLRLLAG